MLRAFENKNDYGHAPADLVAAVVQVVVHVAPIRSRGLHEITLPKKSDLSNVAIDLPVDLSGQPS